MSKLKRCYGWRKDEKDTRDFLRVVQIPKKLPPQFQLTGLPPVYDQGQLGSCTANAIAAAVEFDMLKQKLADWTPSRLFIYYNERVMEGTVSQDSGAQIRDGVKSINQLGVCPEVSVKTISKTAVWPYAISKFAVKPPATCYAEALDNVSLKYERVNQDVASLQAVLASGFPVVFGFNVYASFESAAVAKTGVVPMPKPGEKVVGGHAVLLVGYDATKGTFTVRNSWGASWGQKGYFTMPFAYITSTKLASDFWTIEVVK